MSKLYNQLAEEIFNTLKGNGKILSLFDKDGNRVFAPTKARRVFCQPDKMMITLDENGEDSEVKMYLSQSASLQSLQKLISTIRNICTRYNVLFNVRKFGRDLCPKDFAYQSLPVSESVMESLYGSVKTSYQKIGSTRLVIRHTVPVNEEKRGSRSRKIKSIFIETKDGEKFNAPVNLRAARALAYHTSVGGNPYDDLGMIIKDLANESKNLSQACRHMKHSLSEDAYGIVNYSRLRMDEIKGILSALSKPKKYIGMKEALESNNGLDESEEDILSVSNTMKSIFEDNDVINEYIPYLARVFVKENGKTNSIILSDHSTKSSLNDVLSTEFGFKEGLDFSYHHNNPLVLTLNLRANEEALNYLDEFHPDGYLKEDNKMSHELSVKRDCIEKTLNSLKNIGGFIDGKDFNISPFSGKLRVKNSSHFSEIKGILSDAGLLVGSNAKPIPKPVPAQANNRKGIVFSRNKKVWEDGTPKGKIEQFCDNWLENNTDISSEELDSRTKELARGIADFMTGKMSIDIKPVDDSRFRSPSDAFNYKVGEVAESNFGNDTFSNFMATIYDKLMHGSKLTGPEKQIADKAASYASIEEDCSDSDGGTLQEGPFDDEIIGTATIKISPTMDDEQAERIFNKVVQYNYSPKWAGKYDSEIVFPIPSDADYLYDLNAFKKIPGVESVNYTLNDDTVDEGQAYTNKAANEIKIRKSSLPNVEKELEDIHAVLGVHYQITPFGNIFVMNPQNVKPIRDFLYRKGAAFTDKPISEVEDSDMVDNDANQEAEDEAHLNISFPFDGDDKVAKVLSAYFDDLNVLSNNINDGRRNMVFNIPQGVDATGYTEKATSLLDGMGVQDTEVSMTGDSDTVGGEDTDPQVNEFAGDENEWSGESPSEGEMVSTPMGPGHVVEISGDEVKVEMMNGKVNSFHKDDIGGVNESINKELDEWFAQFDPNNIFAEDTDDQSSVGVLTLLCVNQSVAEEIWQCMDGYHTFDAGVEQVDNDESIDDTWKVTAKFYNADEMEKAAKSMSRIYGVLDVDTSFESVTEDEDASDASDSDLDDDASDAADSAGDDLDEAFSDDPVGDADRYYGAQQDRQDAADAALDKAVDDFDPEEFIRIYGDDFGMGNIEPGAEPEDITTTDKEVEDSIAHYLTRLTNRYSDDEVTMEEAKPYAEELFKQLKPQLEAKGLMFSQTETTLPGNVQTDFRKDVSNGLDPVLARMKQLAGMKSR